MTKHYKTHSIKVTTETYREMQAVARDKDIPLAQVLRIIFRQWVEKQQNSEL